MEGMKPPHIQYHHNLLHDRGLHIKGNPNCEGFGFQTADPSWLGTYFVCIFCSVIFCSVISQLLANYSALILGLNVKDLYF
jgi:hypothetical protein